MAMIYPGYRSSTVGSLIEVTPVSKLPDGHRTRHGISCFHLHTFHKTIGGFGHGRR
jgi:hypothetical protein